MREILNNPDKYPDGLYEVSTPFMVARFTLSSGLIIECDSRLRGHFLFWLPLDKIVKSAEYQKDRTTRYIL